MNLSDTPALKIEPSKPWWKAEEYTSHDGRAVRARTFTKAAVTLYGILVMPGSTRYERTPQETYRAVVPMLCLRAFRRDGTLKIIGSVSYPTTARIYQIMRGY